MKFRFTKPRCEGCDCYVDNRTIYTIRKAYGRKLQPGECYCIHGSKVRRFKKSDAQLYTPGWCPKLYKNNVIRIYARHKCSITCYLLKPVYGEDFELPIDERRYVLVNTTSTSYTPRQFVKELASGLCDHAKLLCKHPNKYDVIEIDNGLNSTYLYCNKDYDWEQLHSFDKAKCENKINNEENNFMLYDPLLRKEVFEDKPWYEEFQCFHAIGVCHVPDEHVADIREALARFLFATRTANGKGFGYTYVIGNGSIEINGMADYILAVRSGNAEII